MNTVRSHLAFRYLVFFIGVSLMALGIALTTKADLGTTPISALPYVASLGFTPSIGFFTVVLNMGLVVMQMAIMGKKFPKVQYLQIPASFMLGFFIDVWMHVLADVAPDLYPVKLALLGAGTIVLALGIFIEVSADVVMMAGEGAVMVLSLKLGREFGTVKTAFDSTLVLLGVGLSFLIFHELQGIREGTVFSALCVGFIVRFFYWLRARVKKDGPPA